MKKTLVINKKEVKRLQELLNSNKYDESTGQDDVIKTFTVNFGKGFEADIKVCNGDGPYIDSVLFLNGHEIQVLEPSGELLGEYCFNNNGIEYNITIKSGGIK